VPAALPAALDDEGSALRCDRACAAAAGLCFCGPPTGLSATARAGGREDPAQLGAALQAVVTPDRWMGLILSGPAECPAPADDPDARGAWRVERPYAGSGDDDLERMCAYAWQGRDPAEAPNIALLPDVSTLRLEQDVAAAFALFEPSPGARYPLEDAFFDQLGFGPEWPGVFTAVDRSLARVRVAMPDSVDRGLALGTSMTETPSAFVASRSGHSAVVGSIINHLVCGRDRIRDLDAAALETCAAEVVPYLALPLLTPTEEAPPAIPAPFGTPYPKDTGGYFGRQADLATAIHRAVRDWQSEAPERRLIINLSLGWDKAYSGRTISTLRMPARAVWAAIRDARCKGALVVAAAGNRGRRADSGAMFPAAWEAQPLTCRVPADAPPAGVYAPLVFAVGGVDGADEALAVSRPLSTPRLVTPAAVVSVTHVGEANDVDELISADVVSGTSVSAAVVSGLAAVVWSHRPALRADEVMQLLYESGADLGRPAEFGLANAGAFTQRRVVFGNALRAACTHPDALECPDEAALTALTDRARAAGVPLVPDMAEVLQEAFPELSGQPAAAAPARVPLAGEATALSETNVPGVFPQPNGVRCGLCAILGSVSTNSWVLQGKLETTSPATAFTSGQIVVIWTNPANALLAPRTLAYPASAALLTFLSFKSALAPPKGYTYPKSAYLSLIGTSGTATITSASEIFTSPP
jgi:hypothetical protein